VKSIWDIETELSAANPAPRARIAELPLAEAEDELLRSIVAEPEPARGARRSRRRTRRYLAVVAAAAAVAGLVVAALDIGKGPGEPEPAFAAELVRFAEHSPLLLLDQPGWQVVYADEQTAIEGEMRFERTSGDAELSWRPLSLGHWKRDRAASAELIVKAPVLDTNATVYQYEDPTRKPGEDLDVTALWLDRGRVLEFRSSVPDLTTFKAQLASLERVDTNTWLSAMPTSVVKAADHDTVVTEMLKGIPLPPGFDPTEIRAQGLTKDRYQLGATVVGTVACSWFQRWWQGRRAGDQQRVREAIAALRTAKDWPVQRAMSKQGAYPEVLEEYITALPSGRWYGRPLIGDVNSGLGCSELGVKLPRPDWG
jgi:hypothetical protein